MATTANKSIAIGSPLGAVMRRLRPYGFIRLRHDCGVNQSYIIDKFRHGRTWKVILANNEEVVVTQTYLPDFKKWLADHQGPQGQ